MESQIITLVPTGTIDLHETPPDSPTRDRGEHHYFGPPGRWYSLVVLGYCAKVMSPWVKLCKVWGTKVVKESFLVWVRKRYNWRES